jgi:hypothetical protein
VLVSSIMYPSKGPLVPATGRKDGQNLTLSMQRINFKIKL